VKADETLFRKEKTVFASWGCLHQNRGYGKHVFRAAANPRRRLGSAMKKFLLVAGFPDSLVRFRGPLLDALRAAGLEVHADAPGCRETVIPGENGFLVPVKSAEALADAMVRLVEDPELARRMGRRSRQIAEEKYDVRKVNAVLLQEMGIAP